MSSVSSFFSGILSADAEDSLIISAKQKCLRASARHLGSAEENVVLQPISLRSWRELQQTFLPILIQTPGDDHYYLSLGRYQKIYDPSAGRVIKCESLNHLEIVHAWQCCPRELPTPTTFSALLKTLCVNFKHDFWFAFFFGCLVSLMTVLISMLSGYLISHIHEISAQHYSPIFLCFFLIFLCMSILIFLDGLHQKKLNLKLLLFTLPGFWAHLVSLPLKTLRQFTTGEMSQKVFDYEIAMSVMPSTLLSIVLNGVALVFLLAYMAYCHCVLALIYLLVSVVFAVIKLYYVPANMICINQMLGLQSRLTQYINEMLLQINKVRSAGCEDKIFHRWLSYLLQSKMHAEQSMLIELFIVVCEAWIPIALFLTCYLALYFFPATIDTSLLLQFMLVAQQFSVLFDKLSARLFTLIHLVPSLQRIQPITAAKPEQHDPLKLFNHRGDGELRLSRVSLCQPNSGQAILNNVTLDFPAGKFTAIIGRSGAGKSSLFKLMLGFESPDVGTISLDGFDYAQFNISDIRKQFGVVLQTTNIFPGTILSNLSAHHPITHDEAWRLARLVGLDEEINAMPMKMHTYISDNAGESISGGQKQKILIARALASNPKVLLLDEATSALDNHAQALIFKNLEALHITRIVIAHRYSTIVNADHIYCLESGRVIDQGNHAELVARGTIL